MSDCLSNDEWMRYLLHPAEDKSLIGMWIILQDKLPSADLSIFCDQEELLVLAVKLLLSYNGDETLYTWMINPEPLSLINNLRRMCSNWLHTLFIKIKQNVETWLKTVKKFGKALLEKVKNIMQ